MRKLHPRQNSDIEDDSGTPFIYEFREEIHEKILLKQPYCIAPYLA